MWAAWSRLLTRANLILPGSGSALNATVSDSCSLPMLSQDSTATPTWSLEMSLANPPSPQDSLNP